MRRLSCLLTLLFVTAAPWAQPRVVPEQDAATGRWGFRAPGQPWVLTPQFDGVWPWPHDLEPGYTEVVVGERRGLVRHGADGARLVLPVEYEWVGRRSESGWRLFGRDSLVWVRKSGRVGYLDGRTWRPVIPPVYDALDSYGSALAALQGGRWGLLSWQGETLAPFVYDSIGSYYSGTGGRAGRGSARRDGGWALVDGALTPLTPFRYSRIRYLYDLRIVTAGGRQGVLTRDGRTLIEPQWDEVEILGFSGLVGDTWRPEEGIRWAAVRRGGLWAPVELWTGWTGATRYTALRAFRDQSATLGYLVAAEAGRYGVIDHRGSWVVPPRYEDVYSYDEATGQARVQQGGLYVTIDHEGRRVDGP